LVVEEKIDIRILARLIAAYQAEQEQALDAQLFKLRLVLLQAGDGFVLFDGNRVTWPEPEFP
jgi:hypothetical protein